MTMNGLHAKSLELGAFFSFPLLLLQVIAPGKRAGDQLDDYIRSRSPSATPPRSPTAQNAEALLYSEGNFESPPQVYSAGVPHAALDQRLGSGYYSSLQQDFDEMATREGGNMRRSSDQSAPSIFGQKSVDSLLTEDSNASHMSGASVKPGSLAEPGSMSLEAYRQEFERSFPGEPRLLKHLRVSSPPLRPCLAGLKWEIPSTRPAQADIPPVCSWHFLAEPSRRFSPRY